MTEPNTQIKRCGGCGERFRTYGPEHPLESECCGPTCVEKERIKRIQREQIFTIPVMSRVRCLI